MTEHKEKGNKVERGNRKEVRAQPRKSSTLTRKHRGKVQNEGESNCILLSFWVTEGVSGLMKQDKEVVLRSHRKLTREKDCGELLFH